MKLEEKTIGSEKIYDGKIIHVRRDTVQLPDGRQSMREVVDHSGGVCVAALTEDDQLLFVRQFRYPYGEVVVELPAGKIEPGRGSARMRQARALRGDRRDGKTF